MRKSEQRQHSTDRVQILALLAIKLHASYERAGANLPTKVLRVRADGCSLQIVRLDLEEIYTCDYDYIVFASADYTFAALE